MGYVRGVMHGALVGAAVGLLLAPQAGTVTRRRVSRWFGQVEHMLATEGEAGSTDASRTSRTRSSSGRLQKRT